MPRAVKRMENKMPRTLRGIFEFLLPLPLDSFLPLALVSYGAFFLLRGAYPRASFGGPILFTIVGLVVTLLDSPRQMLLRAVVRVLLIVAPVVFIVFVCV